jgi:hypothetical protein
MEVKSLKNKHENKLAFVIGAGPSLHFVDVEPLRDYVTITVNSGLVKAPWCDYFLSDDIGVTTWDYYVDLLPKLDCVKLLYDKKLAKHCSHLNNFYFFPHTWWYSPKDKKYNPAGLKLNKTGPIIGAISSVGSAVHFLYLMGCSPIVLLGCDCCYKDGHRYFWQYEGESKPKRIKPFKQKVYDHLYERIYRENIVDYWNNLAKLNPDVNIIDCSDGLLQCFPKMKISEVLEKFGGRKK